MVIYLPQEVYAYALSKASFLYCPIILACVLLKPACHASVHGGKVVTWKNGAFLKTHFL
jgi:hypothetical protein